MRNRDEMMAKKAAFALAAASLALVPTISVAAGGQNRPAPISLNFDKLSNFTPANADPRLAAMFGNRALNEFRFTPAAAKSRPSQVRVAVRAGGGTVTPAQPVEVAPVVAQTTLAPTNYDLGVAVGWRRLAVAGDVSRTKSVDPTIGSRETAVVGVSYNLKKLTGRVAVSGERNDSQVAPLARPDSATLDVGASYNIRRNIAINGGVRYRIERDQIPALADDRRDSKGVYVGTAVKF